MLEIDLQQRFSRPTAPGKSRPKKGQTRRNFAVVQQPRCIHPRGSTFWAVTASPAIGTTCQRLVSAHLSCLQKKPESAEQTLPGKTSSLRRIIELLSQACVIAREQSAQLLAFPLSLMRVVFRKLGAFTLSAKLTLDGASFVFGHTLPRKIKIGRVGAFALDRPRR